MLSQMSDDVLFNGVNNSTAPSFKACLEEIQNRLIAKVKAAANENVKNEKESREDARVVTSPSTVAQEALKSFINNLENALNANVLKIINDILCEKLNTIATAVFNLHESQYPQIDALRLHPKEKSNAEKKINSRVGLARRNADATTLNEKLDLLVELESIFLTGKEAKHKERDLQQYFEFLTPFIEKTMASSDEIDSLPSVEKVKAQAAQVRVQTTKEDSKKGKEKDKEKDKKVEKALHQPTVKPHVNRVSKAALKHEMHLTSDNQKPVFRQMAGLKPAGEVRLVIELDNATQVINFLIDHGFAEFQFEGTQENIIEQLRACGSEKEVQDKVTQITNTQTFIDKFNELLKEGYVKGFKILILSATPFVDLVKVQDVADPYYQVLIERLFINDELDGKVNLEEVTKKLQQLPDDKTKKLQEIFKLKIQNITEYFNRGDNGVLFASVTLVPQINKIIQEFSSAQSSGLEEQIQAILKLELALEKLLNKILLDSEITQEDKLRAVEYLNHVSENLRVRDIPAPPKVAKRPTASLAKEPTASLKAPTPPPVPPIKTLFKKMPQEVQSEKIQEMQQKLIKLQAKKDAEALAGFSDNTLEEYIGEIKEMGQYERLNKIFRQKIDKISEAVFNLHSSDWIKFDELISLYHRCGAARHYATETTLVQKLQLLSDLQTTFTKLASGKTRQTYEGAMLAFIQETNTNKKEISETFSQTKEEGKKTESIKSQSKIALKESFYIENNDENKKYLQKLQTKTPQIDDNITHTIDRFISFGVVVPLMFDDLRNVGPNSFAEHVQHYANTSSLTSGQKSELEFVSMPNKELFSYSGKITPLYLHVLIDRLLINDVHGEKIDSEKIQEKINQLSQLSPKISALVKEIFDKKVVFILEEIPKVSFDHPDLKSMINSVVRFNRKGTLLGQIEFLLNLESHFEGLIQSSTCEIKNIGDEDKKQIVGLLGKVIHSMHDFTEAEHDLIQAKVQTIQEQPSLERLDSQENKKKSKGKEKENTHDEKKKSKDKKQGRRREEDDDESIDEKTLMENPHYLYPSSYRESAQIKSSVVINEEEESDKELQKSSNTMKIEEKLGKLKQNASEYFESYKNPNEKYSIFSDTFLSKRNSRTYADETINEMKKTIDEYLDNKQIGKALALIQHYQDLVAKDRIRHKSHSSLYRRLKTIQSEIALTFPQQAAAYTFVHKHLKEFIPSNSFQSFFTNKKDEAQVKTLEGLIMDEVDKAINNSKNGSVDLVKVIRKSLKVLDNVKGISNSKAITEKLADMMEQAKSGEFLHRTTLKQQKEKFESNRWKSPAKKS